jgi:hypothetical protein
MVDAVEAEMDARELLQGNDPTRLGYFKKPKKAA